MPEVGFIKADAVKRYTLGIVYEPDAVDSQDDFADAEEIEKASHDFMRHIQGKLKKGALGIMHKEWPDDVGDIVECYCAPVDMQIGDDLIKQGTWMLGVIWSEEFFEKIDKKEITGYSMGGSGKREKVEAIDVAAKEALKKAAGQTAGNQGSIFKETLLKKIAERQEQAALLKEQTAHLNKGSVTFSKAFTDLIEKFNPYHDRLGRFAGAGGAFSVHTKDGTRYSTALAMQARGHDVDDKTVQSQVDHMRANKGKLEGWESKVEPPKPKAKTFPKSDYPEGGFKTEKEAKAFIKQFGNKVSLGLPLDKLNDVARGLSSVLTNSNIKLNSIATSQSNQYAGCFQWKMQGPVTVEANIKFSKNTALMSQEARVKNSEMVMDKVKKTAPLDHPVQYSPCHTVSSSGIENHVAFTAAHEAGHALAHFNKLYKPFDDAMKKYGVTDTDKTSVSKYAYTGGQRETFAEVTALVALGHADKVPEKLLKAYYETTDSLMV